MVVFLADRTNLQTRRLHERIKQKLQPVLTSTQLRLARPTEPGQYRVVGTVVPQRFLDDDTYPVEQARVEVGFKLDTSDPYEYYWLNWIEPARNVLVGWHQDETHESLGPVHLQVDHRDTTVARESAHFIDSHPLDVIENRIGTLPDAVRAVEWKDGRPVGLDPTASVVA
jgi:hypothetical protein